MSPWMCIFTNICIHFYPHPYPKETQTDFKNFLISWFKNFVNEDNYLRNCWINRIYRRNSKFPFNFGLAPFNFRFSSIISFNDLKNYILFFYLLTILSSSSRCKYDKVEYRLMVYYWINYLMKILHSIHLLFFYVYDEIIGHAKFIRSV